MARLDPFRSSRARDDFIAQYDAVMGNWPVPFEDRASSTSFGMTHTIVSGPPDAQPLVLFHGANTTAAMWVPVIERLSASYRCYCIDTITDANKSVVTRRLRGVEDHIVWMREVFAALDIQSARVAGLSYGGWLATVLSVHAPELVERLVLLCPAGTFTRLTTEFMVRMIGSSAMRSPALARRSIQWLSSTPDAPSDEVLCLVARILIACRPTMMPPTALTDDELRRIDVPTTVVVGDREVIYRGGPQAALDRARRLIPDVRTRLVRGGHVLTVDCPKELADEVLAALT